MSKKPLNKRMRSGELYFVYTGMSPDCSEFGLLAYGDGTPRIYTKETFDPRVGEIPISLNLKTAGQKLKRGVFAVMMPLSVLLDLFGAREGNKWASTMTDEFEVEMRAYIKNWKKTAKPFRLSA